MSWNRLKRPNSETPSKDKSSSAFFAIHPSHIPDRSQLAYNHCPICLTFRDVSVPACSVLGSLLVSPPSRLSLGEEDGCLAFLTHSPHCSLETTREWESTLFSSSPALFPTINTAPHGSQLNTAMFALLLLGAVTFLVYSIVRYYQFTSKYPKGPRPLPFIGNLLEVSKLFEWQCLGLFYLLSVFFSQHVGRWVKVDEECPSLSVRRLQSSAQDVQASRSKAQWHLHHVYAHSLRANHRLSVNEGSVCGQGLARCLSNLDSFLASILLKDQQLRDA